MLCLRPELVASAEDIVEVSVIVDSVHMESVVVHVLVVALRVAVLELAVTLKSDVHVSISAAVRSLSSSVGS